MQEILGRVTDAHVAAERITELRDHMKEFHAQEWGRYRKPINQLLQAQRRVFPRERKRYLASWPGWKKLMLDLVPESLLRST
jgi:hypothetical protein